MQPEALPAFEDLWTPRRVAQFLACSRSWVYQAAEAGTLPSLKIGGLLRFEPTKVRAFARGELPAAGDVVPMHGRPR